MLKCMKLLVASPGWKQVSFLMCGLHVGNLCVHDLVRLVPWIKKAGTDARRLVKLFVRNKKLGQPVQNLNTSFNYLPRAPPSTSFQKARRKAVRRWQTFAAMKERKKAKGTAMKRLVKVRNTRIASMPMTDRKGASNGRFRLVLQCVCCYCSGAQQAAYPERCDKGHSTSASSR
jgi:hypothetical protein